MSKREVLDVLEKRAKTTLALYVDTGNKAYLAFHREDTLLIEMIQGLEDTDAKDY